MKRLPLNERPKVPEYKINTLPLFVQSLLIMFSLLGKKGKTKWKPVETAQIINPNAPRKLATSSWADETNDLEGKLYQARLIRIIIIWN